MAIPGIPSESCRSSPDEGSGSDPVQIFVYPLAGHSIAFKIALDKPTEPLAELLRARADLPDGFGLVANGRQMWPQNSLAS